MIIVIYQDMRVNNAPDRNEIKKKKKDINEFLIKTDGQTLLFLYE